MANIEKIKRAILDCVNRGFKEFVIYPFGKNGLEVKEYMVEYLNIMPQMIIDNYYCKYNDNIKSKDYLRTHYNGQIIIITVENERLNKIIYDELTEYVDEDRIINRINNVAQVDLLPYRVDQFLPLISDVNRDINGLIKVRIFCPMPVAWNSMSSVVEAFVKDMKYDLKVIIPSKKLSILVEALDCQGINNISLDEYKIEDDLPDIVLLNNPYDSKSYVSNIRNICKLIVVVSMQLVRYTESIDEFWSLQKSGFERFTPDYYLFDSLIYKEILNTDFFSNKIVEMGNSKYDGIYNSIIEKKYVDRWKKCENKKTILWAPDHGVTERYINVWCAVDLYIKDVFEYFKNNSDICLIFRPHPTFILEMRELGLWSEEDIERIKDYCSKSVNIVYDDTRNYNQSYAISDGIITDAYCGVICSALALKKPVCITYRNKSIRPMHDELQECNYAAYSFDDIEKFISIVKSGNDDKKILREKAFKSLIKHFDGKNGERIKNFIDGKYKEIVEESK